MDVVKMGGSVLEHAHEALGVLMGHDVLIVPGGSVFADVVRRVQEKTGISDGSAHRMAVLAMDQYGIYLSDISGIPSYDSLDEARAPGILRPSRTLEAADPFEPSWDVASDTIACYIAKIANAERFFILKSVPGVAVEGQLAPEISAAKLQTLPETCVDTALAAHLLKYRMDCRIVNGRDRNAVEKAMDGGSVGTLVRGK